MLRYGFVALAWLAGIEWLLGRAISRLAASPALEGTARTFIESLGSIGLFLLAPASLLAATLLFVSVSNAGADALRIGDRARAALHIYLGLFGAVSISYAFIPRAPWLTIGYTLMALLALCWIALDYAATHGVQGPLMRVAMLFVSGAYAGYLGYLLLQELEGVALSASLAPIVVRDLGEICLVTAPFLFFAAMSVPYRQWFRPARWILPVVLALALALANIADMIASQGFTGVFVIWGIGLSYFLPWPFYVISLALYVYSVLTCLAPGEAKSRLATKGRAIGLLLLTFASFELQFPYQYVLALLSMMLLSGLIAPFGALASSQSVTGETPVGSQDADMTPNDSMLKSRSEASGLTT
ncbi:MAG: hypothetical protein ABIO92_09265 [Chloroflexia bacterium]